jgi:hypothetical protein
MICPDAFSACARRKGLKNDTLSARATSKGETAQVGVSMIIRVGFVTAERVSEGESNAQKSSTSEDDSLNGV